jgi:hypothetical protein
MTAERTVRYRRYRHPRITSINHTCHGHLEAGPRLQGVGRAIDGFPGKVRLPAGSSKKGSLAQVEVRSTWKSSTGSSFMRSVRAGWHAPWPTDERLGGVGEGCLDSVKEALEAVRARAGTARAAGPASVSAGPALQTLRTARVSTAVRCWRCHTGSSSR